MATEEREDRQVTDPFEDQLNNLVAERQTEQAAAQSSDNFDAQLNAIVSNKPVQPATDQQDEFLGQLDTIVNGEQIVKQAEHDLSQGKPVAQNILNKAKAYMAEKVKSMNWQKFMLTPTGQYYVKLGEKIPFSDQIMEAAGVPSHFDMPALVKYSPQVLATGELANAVQKLRKDVSKEKVEGLNPLASMVAQASVEAPITEIDWSKTSDRFALGLFLDQLILTKGVKWAARLFSNVKFGKIGEFARQVAEDGKLSEEAAEMLRRDAAKPSEQLELALTQQESLPFGEPVKKAPVPAELTPEVVAESQAEQLRLTLDGYAEQVKMLDDAATLGSITYKDSLEGITELKQLNKFEKAAAASVTPKIEGVLPGLGEADITSTAIGRNKNFLSRVFSSPQNVVPELHQLALEKKTMVQDMLNKYVLPVVEKYKDVSKNVQSAERVFKTLDGVENHADMAGVALTAREAEMVKDMRTIFNEIGDQLYVVTQNPALKPGQRMLNYITHVVESTKGQKQLMSDSLAELDRLLSDVKSGGEAVSNKQLSLAAKKMRQAGMGEEGLQSSSGTITAGKRYLKARTGAQGYSLDPFKALNEYVKWAGDFISDKAVKGRWDMVRELYHPELRGYANWYWDNIKNAPHDAEAIRKMSGVVTKITRNAALGLNNVSALINATQSFYFGSARIGYGPWIRGVKKYMQYASGMGKPESLKNMKDLLMKADIEDRLDSFFSARAAAAKGKLAQTGHAIDTASMKMFQEVEKFNRATTYLGAYDDAMYKINQVKQFGPQAMKRTVKWLADRGIGNSGDIEWEAHKYAMKSMAETQFDLAKMYQSQFASNSLAKAIFQFSTFPIKTMGHVMQPFKDFGTEFAKHGFRAFTLPGTKNLLRLVANSMILGVIADAAGIDKTRFALGNMMLVSEGPAMKLTRAFLDTFKAAVEQPGSYTMQSLGAKFLTDLGTGLIPGSVTAKRIVKFMDVYTQNMNSKSDMWTIRDPKTGKVKYQVSPLSAVKMLVVPIADEESFWDLVKQDTDASLQMREAGRNINALKMKMINASYEQQQKLRQELAEQMKQRREASIRSRKVKRERKQFSGGGK